MGNLASHTISLRRARDVTEDGGPEEGAVKPLVAPLHEGEGWRVVRHPCRYSVLTWGVSRTHLLRCAVGSCPTPRAHAAALSATPAAVWTHASTGPSSAAAPHPGPLSGTFAVLAEALPSVTGIRHDLL